MISVKNSKFFHVFILGKIGEENVFHDILDRKNALLDYKNIKLKKSKNWDFSKGVSPRSFSNFFHVFVLGKICQESVFHDILERKNAFLDYKNKKLEK